ncbi:SMC-Scp complex subunit ScpB, partial [Micromonospora phytophila]|nr:SMC-Scp complex subunit ScpB [Micromonospora phytophila]
MSNEERRDSLADQAAAWVPPWERPTPPRAAQPAEPAQPSDEPATPAADDRGGIGSPVELNLPEP